jgi:hypothetical protein
MAARDANLAWQAHRELCEQPTQALALFRGRLKLAKATVPRQLLADLEADLFAKREQASKKLAAALARDESDVEWALRDLRRKSASAEVRRRVERLLRPYEERPVPLSPESLRAVRAIAVLEHIGSKDAITLLRALSGGAPAALTQEARAALARLGVR